MADDRSMDLKSPPMHRLVTTVKGQKKTNYLTFRSGASSIAELMLIPPWLLMFFNYI
jgi:hypothetical protein